MIRATGIPDDRHNGTHVLRHTYASVLLDVGKSIKALSAYLGHADPGFTLRTYTHLLPANEDRTRRAIDKALGETRPAQTLRDPWTAWTGHDHGSTASAGTYYAGRRLCRLYFQRKWTKSRPKFFESFSTRW
ncbi:tyrosine-type recombinase/integrase [Micromonospora sp. WMMD967]|uniref:tyrosine-type recombinase/integrase n=1 Tax=Micromonospora sp. WMMD967 TaxID=3016101 RepID=UPI002416A7DF|nr:tyrosine-type recombinase/integrase [Micromonospora sp. WMMD967]MDG4835318.1 tyrosine-type recombinase/integrase [Micromonospora sp. WMMD967]